MPVGMLVNKDLYQACVKRITEKKEGDCEAWFMEFLPGQVCGSQDFFAATRNNVFSFIQIEIRKRKIDRYDNSYLVVS
jgi:hypothetical protein